MVNIALPLCSFTFRHAYTSCHCLRVLDECDEMLNMGFVDDVEKILNAANSGSDGAAAEPGTNMSGGKLQTLLFSATMPAWVKDITRRFLTKTHKLVDLVGDDKLKVGLHSNLQDNVTAQFILERVLLPSYMLYPSRMLNAEWAVGTR